MKAKKYLWIRMYARACLCCLLFLSMGAFCQPVKNYSFKNGRMIIEITKDIGEPSLDSFIQQYDLFDLGLKRFLKTGNADSIKKAGWKIDVNNESGFILSKSFESYIDMSSVLDPILLMKKERLPLFPATSSRLLYGVNKFHNKFPFRAEDSVVTFFLRNNKNAKQVILAGSFNNWSPRDLQMHITDSGWIAYVKLGAGKYWYKFIVDGRWQVDPDNQLKENDGLGNINSVFYKTNVVFNITQFMGAKKVYLSGSFNKWKHDELLMTKTANGWQLPIYLGEGTHTYKFIADGGWYADESNSQKLPDGHGGFNSVLQIGSPYTFYVHGFDNAKQVMLAGTFNEWRTDELIMKKTGDGWELPYTLGPGNYEYKFFVDGKWMTDPANTGNESSYLIIQPNYTFRLKGYQNAKKVLIAGDFNDWNPNLYSMKKEGDEWVFSVHLDIGKHLYKFIVDGKWIIDPSNKLWEQNEYQTGNSVLWLEK